MFGRTMRLFALAALAALAAATAAAQSDGRGAQAGQRGAATDAERRVFDAADFRAAFEERTIHLIGPSGLHYGSEYYAPGDRTIWIPADGPCLPGDWWFEGDRMCFQYPDSGPHCWLVYEEAGEVYVLSNDGLLLRIVSVEERPLQCDPELLSREDAPISPPTFEAAMAGG